MNKQTQNSESTSDAQTSQTKSDENTEPAPQLSYRSSTLNAQSEELEKRRKQQEEAIKTWTNNNPQTSITSPVLPQATANSTAPNNDEKTVQGILSKYSEEEKLSDKQKVEFIEDLKALENDAPLTSYYLLTYLEREGNTLTKKERSALLKTPHEDDYNYEDDYENAKSELMSQLTEEDAKKILENFEGIIEKNYKKIKKRNKKTAMRLQAELDALVPPI